MKNILMIYPRYPDTFWSFKDALPFVSKKAAYPPLGLLTVASMLPETDFNCRLIDVNVTELRDDDIKWADMVFISAMLTQQKNTREIIERSVSFGKKIVAGGPAFTTSHEKFENVDHFVLGEAEVTLHLFLDDLKKGSPKKLYRATEWPDITKTAIPKWSLINFKNYATMSIQYSRGCPRNCEFCDIIIMNGRVPRMKNPDQLLGEIDSLHKAGWRGTIFIVDDNFIGNKKAVKLMLKELVEWQKKRRYPFSFITEADIDLSSDEELMNAMSAANFDKVFIGLETPSVESLKECKKYQNLSMNLVDAVREILGHGIQVMGGFIVGFDNDPKNIFQQMIQFIQESGVPIAMVSILTALPKTRLWNRLKDEKRLIADSSGENTDGNINFIPKCMDREALIKGYKKLENVIYSPGYYYKRIKTFLKMYKPPRIAPRIDFQHIMALFRATYCLGIKGIERVQYWKLMLWTLFNRPKSFPIAIVLAIYGYHFRKVAERITELTH